MLIMILKLMKYEQKKTLSTKYSFDLSQKKNIYIKEPLMQKGRRGKTLLLLICLSILQDFQKTKKLKINNLVIQTICKITL